MTGDHWKGGILLAALPTEGSCMTLDELEAVTQVPRERITRLMMALKRNGFVVTARVGCYRRTPAGDAALTAGRLRSGPKGPHGKSAKSGLKDKIWRALRIKKRATIADLLDVVDTDVKDAQAMASRYLSQLRRAGITGSPPRRLPGEAVTSNGFKQHVLLRDLGPKAPIWKPAAQRLWDPNANAWADDEGSRHE